MLRQTSLVWQHPRPNHPIHVFKKVIGQDQSESAGSPSAHSEAQTSNTPVTSESNYSASRSSRSGSSTRNVLSSDVDIKGSVKFTDDLVVDGKIEGQINSNGSLTIGENARIKAEICTDNIIVYGKIHGNLTASSRIDIKGSAEVVGDIVAATLSIEAGAIFVGKSTVGGPGQISTSQVEPELEPELEAQPMVADEEDVEQGTLAGTETEG